MTIRKFDVLIIFSGLAIFNLIPTYAYYTSPKLVSHYKTQYDSLSDIVHLNTLLVDGMTNELDGIDQLKERCKHFYYVVDKLPDKSWGINKYVEAITKKSKRLEYSGDIRRKVDVLRGRLHEDMAFLRSIKSDMDLKGTNVERETEIHGKLVSELSLTKEISDLVHDKIFSHFRDIAKHLEHAFKHIDDYNEKQSSDRYGNLQGKCEDMREKIELNAPYVVTWEKIVKYYQTLNTDLATNAENIVKNLNLHEVAEEEAEDIKFAKEYVVYANKCINEGLSKVYDILGWAKSYIDLLLPFNENKESRQLSGKQYFEIKEKMAAYAADFQIALDVVAYMDINKYTYMAIENFITMFASRNKIFYLVKQRYIDEEKTRIKIEKERARLIALGKIKEGDEVNIEELLKDEPEDQGPKDKFNWMIYLIIIGIGVGLAIFVSCSVYIGHFIRTRGFGGGPNPV